MKTTDSIQYLKGVGPKMADCFTRLGIEQIGDFLTHYPRVYLNLSQPQLIKDVVIGEINVIRAQIIQVQSSQAKRKRMNLLKATLKDSSGQIEAIWFNQPFLTQIFKIGQTLIFYGKVERDFQRKISFVSPQFERLAKFIAVYPETDGVSSKYLRMVIDQVLTELPIDEILPLPIVAREKLLDREKALHFIHQPHSWEEINKSRERLAFEELLNLALKLQKNRFDFQKDLAVKLPIREEILKEFVGLLPFELTIGQKKAAWAIIKDMNLDSPMNRLLNGDVGSGKTVVAAMAAYHTAASGFQTAIMAPTEILAQQHYQTLNQVLLPLGVSVGLRTANVKEDKEDKDVVVGTHALIQENISIPKLALVVIDEQHRFGVQQREMLVKKSGLKFKPHFLSMTATPIPRTLSLALYGDLDISVLKEMPKGRKEIVTKIVHPTKRQETYQFIEQEIKNGRQAYVICPLIEKSDKQEKLFDLEKKTVLEEFEKIAKEIFPHRRIGMLHGRLKAKEKEAVMKDFKAGKLDILVATSVVEVGVDVPNATVMMIEGAENFGLAQIWQFRGRVGRSTHQSYCFLFTAIWSLKIKERLTAIVKAKDGFELAEKDLFLRGPGELAGVTQSGLPDFKMASLTDLEMINRTQLAAKEILTADPELEKSPALKEAVMRLATKHRE